MEPDVDTPPDLKSEEKKGCLESASIARSSLAIALLILAGVFRRIFR